MWKQKDHLIFMKRVVGMTGLSFVVLCLTFVCVVKIISAESSDSNYGKVLNYSSTLTNTDLVNDPFYTGRGLQRSLIKLTGNGIGKTALIKTQKAASSGSSSKVLSTSFESQSIASTSSSKQPQQNLSESSSQSRQIPLIASAPIAKAPVNQTNLSPQASRILLLTNQQRQAIGLAALSVSKELTAAAEHKTCDIVKRGYYAHNTPEGLTVAQQVRQFGYNSELVTENLAYNTNQDPDVIFSMWLKSSGHKANLLRSDIREIGIGWCTGSFKGFASVAVVGQMLGAR